MARAAQGDPFLDKGLPSNLEAERSILGAILLDNSLCNQAIELLKCEDFFLDAHRKIFDKMVALNERGMPIDLVTLRDELIRAGQFEQIGGASYLSSLIDGVPRTDSIEPYAKIVKQKAMLRRLIMASNQIIARCFDESDDPDTIVDQAEAAIFQIAEDRIRQGFQPVSAVAERRLIQIEQMAGRPEMITGVPTGFMDFDQMTAGLQRQDLIIIAARPSQGKCLAGDSEITLSDGSLATIEQVCRRKWARLLTLGDDYRFRLAEPSAFVCDGVKPVYRVTTELGRCIETTLTHPFLTPSGWRSLELLKPGDQIALPRALRIFGAEQMRDCDVKLLAYLIGYQRNRPLHPAAQLDLQDAILESRSAEQVMCGRPPQIALSAARRLPAAIFRLNRSQLALFLNRLFAAGGHMSERSISYAAPGCRLARQLQHLLLRFGVIAALKRARRGWLLEISDPESIERFASEISICGQRDQLEALLESSRRGPVFQTAGDILWDQITSIEAAGNKRVYDLTIPGTHNFVANDICVHNTALALNIAQYAARNGYVVGIFSLEMSAEQLVSRLLCSEARIDAHRLRTGYLNREEWAKLADALRRLCDMQIYIDDTPGIGVLEMRAKSRRLKAERGLDLLIIDYLQLMSGRGRFESRQQEVSQISRDLKALAKELDIPVIALSQLSRAPETRSDHRPMLSDLRESGSLEQDADVVCFIYREEVYNPTEENRGIAELIIGKQRNGPVGTVRLAFLKEFTRFENMWRE